MRTRITYLALAALCFAGCAEEPVFNEVPLEGIVLKVFVEDQQTRATRPGDASLNENVISNRIDVFFYNESTDSIKKEALNQVRSGDLVQIQTNPNDIENIFGTLGAGAHCGVFVVANFSGTYAGEAGSRTLTEIKSSLLPAPSWESHPAMSADDLFNPQTSFVMTGQQQVTLQNAQGSTPVYAEIGLARVAVKITFDVTVAETVLTEDEEDPEETDTWLPDTGGMTVYMVYAMRKANLGADPQPMPPTASTTYTVNSASETIVYSQYNDKKLFNTGTTKPRSRRTGSGTTTVNSPVYSTAYNGADKPFYSYPCEWETGSSMEPYMKLIIPWTYGSTTRKYYYKIPFHGNALERNHWYHISIDVQILGTVQADPPEVEIHYAIADWAGTMDTATAEDITSVTSVPATVIMTRYLSVPTTEYVLYNEERLTIPIQSSHDVEVLGFDVETNAYKPAHFVDANYVGSNPRIYNPFTTTLNSSDQIVAVRPDYSASTPSAVSHSFTYDEPADAQGWSVTVQGRENIILVHPLNSDTSSDDYDVAPYTIRMRIRHQGEGSTLYFTDVTIEQRPSIIIKPDRNSDEGDFISGYNIGNNHTREDGYVFINGTRSNTDQSSNRNNYNFNMYVIETSVLPTSGDMASYVLGDPRSNTSTTISGTNNGKAIDTGTTRTLANYYEAGEEEDYDNFVAPKFRIASSFGASPAMTRTNAKLRCAAYQEDGYPAGRWRLPTVAEIVYMARLTADGLIPRLLGNEGSGSTDYWCNSGFVSVPNGTNANSTPSSSHSYSNSATKNVRCVYDEWYWEDTTYEKADKTVYTWGDLPRSAVRKN